MTKSSARTVRKKLEEALSLDVDTIDCIVECIAYTMHHTHGTISVNLVIDIHYYYIHWQRTRFAICSIM